MLEYKLIRSKRRTVSVQVMRDGSFLVRAPMFYPQIQIDNFIMKKQKILEKHRAKMLDMPATPTVNRLELEQMKSQARLRILPRVEALSHLTGLTYQGAKITTARGRFGSCSSKNHLCFSVFLNLTSDAQMDYVIIHELCHTLEHNHSPKFYALVSRFLPDWKEREKSLREIIIPEIVN